MGSGRSSWIAGSAMARMPRARGLEYRDWDSESVRQQKRTRPGDDHLETLYDRMLQPTDIFHVRKHNLE